MILFPRDRQYDPAFDVRIASPAYSGNGPLVIYDEGHLNAHTADAAYRPLVSMIRGDGYAVRVSHQEISAGMLNGASILMIVCARGKNDANDAPAFSDAEAGAIVQWVEGGGSLLLVTDHWPYGAAAEPLAVRFGMRMGKGLVEDPGHHDAVRGSSHIVFTRESGLPLHPIVEGRNPSERVLRVLTFTGQSLSGPPSGLVFLQLSDSAVEYPPASPKVEKDGGDVRVTMTYGSPASVAGRAQGIALDKGKGRVVVLAEAGMLRAQNESNGLQVGMNVAGYDNRQLALNIMHWLSHLL